MVDDHAAVRLGLEAAISSRPGLVSVGVVDGPEALAPLLYRARPDVVEKLRAGNMKPIGVIVGHVMRETKGRADGGEVTRIVREKLGL